MKITTLSHIRKLALLFLAVTLSAVAAILSMAGSASAAASWKYWQLDGDRCWDSTTLDASFNGNYEVAWFDLDNDCRWDTKIWNSVGGDDFAESMTYDMNEDGRWEFWLVDTNQRVGFDVVYFDDDADGYYDRWAPMAASRTMTLAEVLGQGSFGGTIRQSGAMGLVTYLAGYTGQAAWAPGDRDSDGCPDALDIDTIRRDC
jgi:hypothetical protein